MRAAAVGLLMVAVSAPALHSQATPTSRNISVTDLQSIIRLPLGEAVQHRESYKAALRSAYTRQMALIGKDCQRESEEGQQTYNICMGKAEETASVDYGSFYNSLQWLCHDPQQLEALQRSQANWQTYHASALDSTRAAWGSGTGAPGFAAQVDLTLLRDRMQELHEIFGLNIAQ